MFLAELSMRERLCLLPRQKALRFGGGGLLPPATSPRQLCYYGWRLLRAGGQKTTSTDYYETKSAACWIAA